MTKLPSTSKQKDFKHSNLSASKIHCWAAGKGQGFFQRLVGKEKDWEQIMTSIKRRGSWQLSSQFIAKPVFIKEANFCENWYRHSAGLGVSTSNENGIIFFLGLMLGKRIYKIWLSQMVSVALLWLLKAYSAKRRQNFPDYLLKFVSYLSHNFQFPCVYIIKKNPKQNNKRFVIAKCLKIILKY